MDGQAADGGGARRWRERLRPHLRPAGILALGASLPIARVLVDPFGSLPGHATGDVYKHAWPYWHTVAQLSAGTWPRTEFLAAPEGGVLLDVMWIPALIMAPITAVFGPVFAANLWVWLSLLATGVATYALARHLVRSTSAAVAVGLLAQTPACLVSYGLASGVHERLALWLFPAVILMLWRSRESGGWRWPLALGLTLTLGAIHCPNYGLFACLLLAVAFPVVAWPARGEGIAVRRLLPAVAAMGLSLAIVVPTLQWMILQPDFLADVGTQRVEFSTGTRAVYEAASIPALLDPFTSQATVSQEYEDEIYKVPYVGWVPLLATLVGTVLAWRSGRRRVALLACCGLLFGLLATGPSFRWGESGISNPLFQLLVRAVPFYGRTPGIWQQVAVLATVGGLGVAMAIASLASRPRRRILAGAIVVLALIERSFALPVPLVAETADARVPEAYSAVGDEGALAEIPRFWQYRHLTPGPAFLAQTRHERPITFAIDYGLSPWDGVRVLMDCQTRDFALSAGCMRQGGIRWVAVHRNRFMTREAGATCARGFGSVAGAPVADDGKLAIFDLTRLERLPPADMCAQALDRESTRRFQDREERRERPEGP